MYQSTRTYARHEVPRERLVVLATVHISTAGEDMYVCDSENYTIYNHLGPFP